MPAQATMIPQQQLIDAAKASLLAYNDKDWTAAKASLTPDFLYEEIATRRTVQGADKAIALWQGWAKAFTDSRATINRAVASGETVTLELTWHGTHNGPLETPKGAIPPTGKRIEVRACCVVEMAGEKAKAERHYFDMGTLLQQIGVGG
ncbi:MAG: ester cyclase [Deltaproteobacteria bacterium]